MPAQETPLEKAKREVRMRFEQSLGGTTMAPAAWAYYERAFEVTLDSAITKHGGSIWKGQSRTYALAQVRLIARIARYFAKNSPQITKSHIRKAIDIGIEQARFECAVNAPGRSCQNYQGPMP